MPNITVDIGIYCAKCGAPLCNATDVRYDRTAKANAFYVEPCDKCLTKAGNDGYDEGYEDAMKYLNVDAEERK